MTPLPHGAPAYTVRVERMDYAGRKQSFEFDGYGLLRELMDDIETEAEKRGWFEDTNMNSEIKLTKAEMQSGMSRVKWAELLILQLPQAHDGRNSWLLNFGVGPEADAIRKRQAERKMGQR